MAVGMAAANYPLRYTSAPVAGGQVGERRHAGLQEVLTPTGRDELLQFHDLGGTGLHYKAPGTGEGILLCAQAEDASGLEPLALDELELSLDVRAVGHEDRPHVFAVLAVGHPAADQPVASGPLRVLVERVTRVG